MPGSLRLLSCGVTPCSSLSSALQSQCRRPNAGTAQRSCPAMAAPAEARVRHAAQHSTLLLRKSSSPCQQARTHGRIFPAIASADVKGINIAVCSPQVLRALHYPYAALLPSEKHQRSPCCSQSFLLVSKMGFSLIKKNKSNCDVVSRNDSDTAVEDVLPAGLTPKPRAPASSTLCPLVSPPSAPGLPPHRRFPLSSPYGCQVKRHV